MITLRPYQEAAQASIYDYLQAQDDSPCVEIPTGGGKSPLMASICHDLAANQARVAVLEPRRELIEQVVDKLRDASPELDYGIFSAGLNRRETENQIIVAGIHSVHSRATDLGRLDLVLIDEAHLIPPDGDGMYRTFLSDARRVNPDLRIVGLTATPYRLASGPLCTPDGILNDICYRISVSELIRDGYLSPLVTTTGAANVDTGELHVRGGEFVESEAQNLMDTTELVQAACAELVEKTADRHSCLIFATGVVHAEHIVETLRREHGAECGFVFGASSSQERIRTIERFRAGDLKFLVNVNVLTTGFDAPNIDCVALLRPTMSPGLYYQMVGRGFRLDASKQNCLVLDFGGNIERHGPVDRIEAKTPAAGMGEAPTKECPDCNERVFAGCLRCPHCGFEFPPPNRQQHTDQASEAAILSPGPQRRRFEVLAVRYFVHTRRGAMDNDPRTLRVEYVIDPMRRWSEYICFEHKGLARQLAVDWWRLRSNAPVPSTAREAFAITRTPGIARTIAITTEPLTSQMLPRTASHELGPIPSTPVATVP